MLYFVHVEGLGWALGSKGGAMEFWKDLAPYGVALLGFFGILVNHQLQLSRERTRAQWEAQRRYVEEAYRAVLLVMNEVEEFVAAFRTDSSDRMLARKTLHRSIRELRMRIDFLTRETMGTQFAAVDRQRRAFETELVEGRIFAARDLSAEMKPLGDECDTLMVMLREELQRLGGDPALGCLL